MLKKMLILLLISGSFIFAEGTKSHQKKFGLGVMLGEPSGLSGKYYLNSTNAIDFGLGYSVATKGKLVLHVDYLHHKADLFDTNEPIILHYGFGAKIKTYSDKDDVFGVRGVVGLTWSPTDLPVDAFFEVAPVFNLLPSTKLELDVSLGSRYYFDLTP